MRYIHLFLCVLLCLCGLFVALSINPISSIIFLILTFCNAAAILFFFNIEFLGVTFVIIYVGAVAVLFLFVVMMINVKLDESLSKMNISFFLKFAYSSVICFLIGVLLLFSTLTVFSSQDLFLTKYANLHILFDTLYNIDVLGQSLYNYFLPCFLIAGLILFIALLGSIVLTLKYNSKLKTQIYSRQLSRSDKFLSFFK
jgi:NADH-quinone oxidoreductase subunit J